MELVFEGKLYYYEEHYDDWGGLERAVLKVQTDNGEDIEIGSKIAEQMGENIPRSCLYSKRKYKLTIQLCLEEIDE